MEEILKVDEKILSRERLDYMKKLNSQYNFYNIMKQKDRDAIGRPSTEAFETALSLENFLATFSAVRECTQKYLVSKGLDREYLVEDFNAFLNIFSAYAGVIEGQNSLNLNGEDAKKDKTELNFLDFKEKGGDPDNFLEVIIASYIDSLDRLASSGKQMKKLLSVMYNSLEEKIKYQRNKYPLLASTVSEIVLSVNNSKIKGFSSSVETQEILAIDKNTEDYMTFDKIIGNNLAKIKLRKYAEDLFEYDAELKKNPVSEISQIPKSIFLYARPGTGKTSLAAAMRNYMLELQEITKKNFVWVTIDSSIKSKWYGETEAVLKAKTKEAMSPKNIGVIFIDDIETFLVSRTDDTSNAIDRALTMYLNQLIEGIDTAYHGNYLILSASNMPDQMDEATRERIGQKPFKVPGPETIDEYVAFLKIKLEKGINGDYMKIRDSEWVRAAELCKKYEETLSPRDITKAMWNLLEDARNRKDFDASNNLSYEKRKAKILSECEPIDINKLLAAIENKYKEELDQEKVSHQAEINRKASHLEREYYAMKKFEEIMQQKEGNANNA